MVSATNHSWLNALAAALPNTTVEGEDHPYFLHNSGLTFSVSDERDRYMFSIRNLHAVNSTGVQCPIAPPRPITLDRHRTTAKIAAEVHRRLLLPGLQWLPQALQWQERDAAQQRNLTAIRTQFLAVGSQSVMSIDQFRGYDPSWSAQLNPTGSVTLHIDTLSHDKALAIIKLLQEN